MMLFSRGSDREAVMTRVLGFFTSSVLAAFLLVVSSAQAMTITDSAATPDSSSAIEFNATDGTSVPFNNTNSGFSNVGQSFKHSSAFTLVDFIIRISTINQVYSPGNITASIYKDTNNDGVPDTLVQSESAISPLTLNANDYLSFAITPVAIPANQTYSFGLGWDTSTHDVSVAVTSTSTYANGQFEIGGTNPALSTYDMVFYTYAPEPASFALLAAGSIMVLGRHRRRVA
jgi:hypothetical protein